MPGAAASSAATRSASGASRSSSRSAATALRVRRSVIDTALAPRSASSSGIEPPSPRGTALPGSGARGRSLIQSRGTGPGSRQAHLEHRPARPALDPDVASGPVHDAAGDVEPESGALADPLGGEEGLEGVPAHLGGHARTGVPDLDDDPALAVRAGGHPQRPALTHGVERV